MWRAFATRLVWAAVILAARGSAAGQITLTLDRALALAVERGPASVAARARIDEARGREAGARVLLRENPELEVLGGRRAGPVATSRDLEVSLTQLFETGGQRGARTRAARASIEGEVAAAENTLRLLRRDVSVAFVRLLHADERVRIATASALVAEQLSQTAERRRKAGDIADLDLNLARNAVARARSEVLQAEAQRYRAAGELKAAIGLRAEDEVNAAGDLRAFRSHRAGDLQRAATSRPDLRIFEAEGREAGAQADLGRALAWPDVGLRFEYHREAEEDVLLGGLSLRLPLFERGQEMRAVGRARRQRAAAEMTSHRDVVAVEVATAFEVYARLGRAVDELEKGVLPVLDENETLARKSFDAGQIGVGDYLLIRREILDARRAYLDQLLERAIAGAELAASAGVSP